MGIAGGIGIWMGVMCVQSIGIQPRQELGIAVVISLVHRERVHLELGAAMDLRVLSATGMGGCC